MVISISDLLKIIKSLKTNDKWKFILTSCPGSPLHNGHVNLLRSSKDVVCNAIGNTCTKCIPINHCWGIKESGWCPTRCVNTTPDLNFLLLIVLVNDDTFLVRKHGYAFQDQNTRASIIDSIKDVDYTVIWHSENNLIDEAIRLIGPHYLTKGGDRTPDNMAKEEIEACTDVGCTLLYNVGGGKQNSSSEMLENYYRYRCAREKWKVFDQNRV